MKPINLRQERKVRRKSKGVQAILRLRRAMCGPGYDSVCENMKHDNGYVTLYINREAKVAFTSNIGYNYIKFSGAEVMYSRIEEELADEVISELLSTGEITSSFKCTDTFFI